LYSRGTTKKEKKIMRYSQNKRYGKNRTKKGKGLAKGLYLEHLQTRLEAATSETERSEIQQQISDYVNH
jgi:hypothetical protein